MLTHTFELEMNGVNVHGELNFNGGSTPRIKFDSSFEVEIKELSSIEKFIKELQILCRDCGTINKIEIVKKLT
jgi:hypothetical protein